MSKINLNNISRLKYIVNRIKLTPANCTIKVMWSVVFNININDTATMLKLVSDTIKVLDSINTDISNIDGINKDIYLRPIEQIKQAISYINLDSNSDIIKNQISQEVLTSLDFCVDMILREKNKIDIDQDEIIKIKKDIFNLNNEIISSEELEVELKNILVNWLNRMEDTISYYMINGIDGLKETFENITGSFVMNYDLINKNKENENVKKIFNILSKILTILSIGTTSYTLSGPIMKLLGQ